MKITISAVAVLAICQVSRAQTGTPPAVVPAPVVNTVIEPHHASTVMESVDRGRAAVIRSVGEATRNIAAAQIDLRTAERMAIDNWQHGVGTKWSVQDAYQMRLKEQYKPLSPEHYRQMARDAAPRRLSVAQLGSDGSIRWPKGLLDDQLAPLRMRLDSLFAARAAGMTDVGFAANSLDIQQTTDELLNQLRMRIELLPSNDYLDAKKFVASLRYEGMLR